MTDLLANLSVPWGTQAIVCPNLTAAALVVPGSGKGLAPFCTFCCCGLLNRTLAVVFMVSLAFAIVVGNVVTLTVFMQTRQVRTPQGYLKGIIGDWRNTFTEEQIGIFDTVYSYQMKDCPLTFMWECPPESCGEGGGGQASGSG